MRQEIGLLLIAIGFLLLMASVLQNFSQGNSNYREVILIERIPIVFESSLWMTGLSTIVTT